MELQIIIVAGIGLIVAIAAFIIGRKSGNKQEINILQMQNNELKHSLTEREERIATLSQSITSLTSERDVQHATAKALQEQLHEASKAPSRPQTRTLRTEANTLPR